MIFLNHIKSQKSEIYHIFVNNYEYSTIKIDKSFNFRMNMFLNMSKYHFIV